jgi:16S rRNA (guanine527-N7)-methyltransferase
MSSVSSLAQRPALKAKLASGAAALGLALPAAVAERLIDYVELLSRWNAAYNLTAVRDPAEMVTRHLLDSLAIARLVRGATLADLGTGAGLPGIPLALLEADRQVTLVDSNGKKIRFLREAVRALGLKNVRIEQSRVENLRGQYDCVVARAFAALADLLTWGGHLLAPDGVFVAMKGALDKDEMRGLPEGFAISEVIPLNVPGLGAARHAVIIRRGSASGQRLTHDDGE